MAKDKASQRWLDYFQHSCMVDERSIIGARARIANGPDTPERAALSRLLDYSSGTGWIISSRQTAKGYEWIKKNRNRKILKTGFGDPDWTIFDRFNHFLFVGLIQINPWQRYNPPVYRVIANNGDYFDYALRSGQVEVIQRYIREN